MSDQSIDQSTDSVDRLASTVSQATPTDGRTDGLTKNLQDLGDSLTFLNAHEESGKFDRLGEPQPIADLVRPTGNEVWRAGQRAEVRRDPAERQPLNRWTRSVVLHRDRHHCAWCGSGYSDDFLEIDHLIPWSAGGSNATDNLRTLCRGCNQARSNRRADYAAARPLLIVTSCPRERASFDSDWTGEAVTEWGDADREVPVFCIGCNARSTVSRERSQYERRRQHDLPPTPATESRTA